MNLPGPLQILNHVIFVRMLIDKLLTLTLLHIDISPFFKLFHVGEIFYGP